MDRPVRCKNIGERYQLMGVWGGEVEVNYQEIGSLKKRWRRKTFQTKEPAWAKKDLE